MIVTLLIPAIIIFFSAMTAWLPHVTQLPFGVDSYLVQAMGYFFYIADVIPTLGILYTGFLVVLDYKVVMLFLKLIRVVR